MTDNFTITRTYDRDEIIDWVKKCIAKGGDIFAAKRFLDDVFTGWNFDRRTSCMVELMFRDKDDMFYDLFTEKLAALDVAEGRCPINVDQFRL